jgi:hypothetical protein
VSNAKYIVTIDRLVLRGLDLTPTEAERFRGDVTAALEAALEGQDTSEGVTSADVKHMRLSPLSMRQASSDCHLATALARKIAQALPGGGRSEGAKETS